MYCKKYLVNMESDTMPFSKCMYLSLVRIGSVISYWLVLQIMKEWQTARKHVNNLKKTNPKAADKLNKNILQVLTVFILILGYFHEILILKRDSIIINNI